MKLFIWFFKCFSTIISACTTLKFYYIRKKHISRVKSFRKIKHYVEKISDKLDIEYRISGLDNLPVEESYLLCANHLSLLDPFVFFKIFNDPISFVSKVEVKKMPVIKDVMGLIDGYYLERGNLKQEIKVMHSIKNDMLKKNIKYIIFPEGTRSKNLNGQMNEFKPGAFKYTMSIGKKIVPVCLYGTQKIFDKNCKDKKYFIDICILDPITNEQYKNMSSVELSSLIQNRIQDQLNKILINH